LNSLRIRLFAILVAATSVIWLVAVAWFWWESRNQFESILDRRLMEAARMVATLAGKGGALGVGEGTSNLSSRDAIRYERHLSCQIWSFDGRLIGSSSGAPVAKLTEQAEGFSQRDVDGEHWRIYSLTDPEKGVRILVGDSIEQRQTLEQGIIEGVLLTAAFVLPGLALLIWFSIGRGLRPLRVATQTLAARDAANLEPLGNKRTPSEIRPLIDALNALFGKVAAARDHERGFIAYAAHELRTPLAGLKTQVQVALAAGDATIRGKALRQILQAVDRTSRMVHQLLAMSRLDACPSPGEDAWIAIEEKLRDLLEDMDRALVPERTSFAPGLDSLLLRTNDNLFDLAARNLMENALQMTPRDGAVRWIFEFNAGLFILSLIDDGPGIQPEDRDEMSRPFVRGKNKSTTGSGLGLAIVSTALAQTHARLRLDASSKTRGLKADMVFEADRVRSQNHGHAMTGTIRRTIPSPI
jgi:two-component system, OmpR family, sensor histidine kinase QseC